MTDKYDEQAEKLLPCTPICRRYKTYRLTFEFRNAYKDGAMIAHADHCSWGYRPIVAAALREKDAEIERLKTQLKAEAERVTERDARIAERYGVDCSVQKCDEWHECGDGIDDAIRAAQAKEREG